MVFVQNIPILLALFSSLIISIISIVQKVSFTMLCVRVFITFLIFYALGLYVRKILVDMISDVILKKRQEELEMKRKKEQEQKEEKNNKSDGNDTDDDFSLLEVAQLDKNQTKIIGNSNKNE